MPGRQEPDFSTYTVADPRQYDADSPVRIHSRNRASVSILDATY